MSKTLNLLVNAGGLGIAKISVGYSLNDDLIDEWMCTKSKFLGLPPSYLKTTTLCVLQDS